MRHKQLQLGVLALLTLLAIFSTSVGITVDLKTHASILCNLVVYTWCLNFVNLICAGGALNHLGIRPRKILGVLGILFAPLLHGDWNHLMGNTIPFIILGWFIMLRGISDFFIVTAVIVVFGGFGVWLFGRDKPHIGASGVNFGYLGFLLLQGYFQRDLLSVALALIVGLLYGQLLRGLLPSPNGLSSWEAHLFGFIAGVLAARFLVVLKLMFPLPHGCAQNQLVNFSFYPPVVPLSRCPLVHLNQLLMTALLPH